MELTSHRWSEVRRIYEQALEFAEPMRSTFVGQACGGDAELRREVDSLLAAREQAADFLVQPIVDLKAGMGADTDQTRVGQQIGPYRLEAQIGQGGMGEVYRAVRADGEFDRQVAIKLVRGGFDTHTVLNRFRQEKQILAALQHPHIAQLLDAGATDEGIPYLVIEYVDGTPIDKYCETNKADFRTRLRIFLEVCDTVQFAHQRLVVHRDLKPANILVTAGGSVKLLDFGIAKVLDHPDRAELTQTLMMTPAYASPEQIRGEAITTLSDVFSLGVLLYKLLAGKSPYSKDTTNAHSLAIEICDRDPPSFASVSAAVPRELELIVRKALRKAPADRYSSVEEFARDVHRYLEGRPVLAAKGSALYRLRKFVGRNRVSVTVSLFALALATGGIWEIVQQRQIAERRFNDVRQLANTIVFDVHDAIADLPGSTPARKVIVQRALEYLDRLEREGAANAELQRDMASAYEKIANVQGAPNSPNVGEVDGADKSYRKAVALREALASGSQSTTADQLALAKSRRIFATFLVLARGDMKAGERMARDALMIGTQLAARSPDDRQIQLDLSDNQQFLGDIISTDLRGDQSRLREATTLFKEAERNVLSLVKSSPTDDLLKHKSVIIAASFADLSRQLGERGAAVASLERARATLLDMATRSANPKIRSNIAIIDATVGEIHLVDGNSQAAAAAFRSAHERRQLLLAEDPSNATSQSNEISNRAGLAIAEAMMGQWTSQAALLAKAADEFHDIAARIGSHDYRQRSSVIDIWSGYAHEKSDQTKAANRFYERALAKYESVLASDAENLDTAISKAMTLIRLGHVALRQKDTESANRYFASASRLADELKAKNPPYADIDFALAESYAGSGDAHAATGNRLEAKTNCEKSLAALRRISNPGVLSSGGFPVQSLAVIEEKLQKLQPN